MRPPEVTHTHEDGLFVSHFVSWGSLLEKFARPAWDGTWYELDRDKWAQYGVSGDHYAAFLALPWRLLRGLEVWACLCWDAQMVLDYQMLDQTPELVRWEFNISDDGSSGKFVPGRTCAPKLGDNPIAYLVPIRSWREFVELHQAGRTDQTSEVFAFGLEPGRSDHLLAALRGPEAPSLVSLLETGERFAIARTEDGEPQYANAFWIAARDDITSEVEQEWATLSNSLRAYEDHVEQVTDIDEWLAFLTRSPVDE
jgi:hypothetical protein